MINPGDSKLVNAIEIALFVVCGGFMGLSILVAFTALLANCTW